MTNAETRAELERIGLGHGWDVANNWAHTNAIFALRLLAESQQALRKISGLLQHQLDNEDPGDLVTILHLLDALMIIAKTAIKEEYRGPKVEPIPLMSLKCKCGYVLKPQDKSCPNCDKLFGKEE